MPLAGWTVFIAIKNQKTRQKKKKKLYPFSAFFGIKDLQGHYIWYQSKVKTLGPNGLINMQV